MAIHCMLFQCSQHGMHTYEFMENAVIYVVTSIMAHHTGLCLPLSEHVKSEKSVAVFRNNTTWVSSVSGPFIPQTLIEMRRWVIISCPSRTCAVFRASHGRSTMQERSQTLLPRQYNAFFCFPIFLQSSARAAFVS